MALPGTIGDPLKPIKDKLNDIERAVDKLSKDNAKDNSEEITEIKESIQSISKLLKNIVDGMETDEVRLQNRTEMESHITQSVNDNINTQMSNIKNDLKQTKFSVTLKEDQLQIFREFLKALSPEARSEFGEFLDKHVKHPQFRNPTNSLRSVDIQSPLPGDTDPFSRNNNEGEDKALKATFHVYTGKDCADL